MSSSVYLCVFVRVCVPLSLSLRASYSGERVSVEGPSGLGKTRLLRAIAELDRPLGGTMTLSAMEVRQPFTTPIAVCMCCVVLCCVVLCCVVMCCFVLLCDVM